jgi:tetratricopeptide (TPR) repeat protein
MIDVSDKMKLGDLIVELGVMDNRDLGQALSIAKETSLPLGRVLVLSEMLTEEELQGTLRCQSLLKQELVELDMARKAMELVTKDHISLDDALFKLGWNPPTTKDTTPLGELLIDAGYVTREQLQQSLDKNNSTGLPFGRLLVLSGALTEGLLTGALNAQILIRDGKLSNIQAIEALKEAKLRQITVEVQLKEKGFYDLPSRSSPRLGELLLFCGVISQSDLVSALELGLMNKTPVGQVLTESNHVSAKLLDAALQVQNLMAEQNMTITDARSVIAAVKDGSTLEEALQQIGTGEAEQIAEEAEKSYLSLFDFLKTLGRIDDDQANEAFQLAKHNTDVLSQVLLISGSLGAETIERANLCRKMVQDKKLNLERANIAFDYAERFNIDGTRALKDLQWYVPEEDMPDEESLAKAAARAKEKEEKDLAKGQAGSKDHAAKDHATKDTESKDTESKEKEQTADPMVAAESDWETLQKRVAHLTASGKIERAMDSAVMLLQLSEEYFPDRMIECLDSVASLHTHRRNLDLAEQYYSRSLELRKKSEDQQEGLLAEGYANLGKVAYFKKDYTGAEDYARKFIEVVAKDKGKEHPNVACGWQNLGNIFYAQKKYSNAQRAYKVGIHICEKGLGESHPTTVQMKRSYEVVLQDIENEEGAGKRDIESLGRITGSWRTLPRDASQSLHEE